MNSFSGYHPLVLFSYFTLVITFSMFFMNPVCMGISALCAFVCSAALAGRRAVRFNLLYMLPLLIFAAALNPLFNHEGVTILTYLPSENPLTLESIIYGVAAALLLVTTVMWFSCYNSVITSDKFIYLFGRIIPALSLIISMALRFVPRFKAQVKVVSNAQKCVGRDVSNGNIFRRARHGVRIISIMVTWALENAIETSDSMRSRGYGLPGRTAFSIFRFTTRDKWALIFLFGTGTYVAAGAMAGGIYWRYFPYIHGILTGPYAVSIFCAYFALCAAPVAIGLYDARRWKTLSAKRTDG